MVGEPGDDVERVAHGVAAAALAYGFSVDPGNSAEGCEVDADCGGGYLCDTRKSPSVCVRPPIGVGEACQDHADCADFEATYCVTLMMGGCALECSVAEDCVPGDTCCDLSAVGLAKLCTPESLCPF